jgi:hypothetical protein
MLIIYFACAQFLPENIITKCTPLEYVELN